MCIHLHTSVVRFHSLGVCPERLLEEIQKHRVDTICLVMVQKKGGKTRRAIVKTGEVWVQRVVDIAVLTVGVWRSQEALCMLNTLRSFTPHCATMVLMRINLASLTPVTASQTVKRFCLERWHLFFSLSSGTERPSRRMVRCITTSCFFSAFCAKRKCCESQNWPLVPSDVNVREPVMFTE